MVDRFGGRCGSGEGGWGLSRVLSVGEEITRGAAGVLLLGEVVADDLGHVAALAATALLLVEQQLGQEDCVRHLILLEALGECLIFLDFSV